MIMRPSGWKHVRLMDLVELHDSRRVPLNAQSRANRHGPFPYYGANGQVDSIDDYIFEGDFILLAEDGGYFNDPSRGVAYEASGKFWVNNHAHILSAKPGIPRRYLTYVLNSLDWMPFVGGSTRLKLTQEGLKRITIPVAPPDVLQSIADDLDTFFSHSNTARAELRRIPRLVERYKQSCLTNCFQTLNVNEEALGSLISFGPQNGLYLPKTAYGSGTPILRIENYGFDRVEPISKWKQVRLPEDQIGRYDLAPNDIIINRVNSPSHLGKSMIIKSDHAGAVFESNMMRIRVDNEISPHYVQAFLASDYGRSRLTKHAKWAVNQASINQEDVRATPIPVPSLKVQYDLLQQIRKMHSSLESILNETTSAQRLVDRLDQATLAKTFRGELLHEKSIDAVAER